MPLWRPSRLLLVVVLALLAATSPTARQARAAAVVTVDPGLIDVTVPFGQSLERTVTISNPSSDAVTLSLYEANGAVPVSSRAASAPGPRFAQLPAQAERLDRALVTEMAATPSQPHDFIVYMQLQADVGAAYSMTDWTARGQYVYQTLREFARTQQQDLIQQIEKRGLRYRSLWIVNAVLVYGTLSDAQAFAERADVAFVRANRLMALAPAAIPEQEVANDCSPDNRANPVCWNIRAVGADRVWRDFGVTGQGVTVANLDTGVWLENPALFTNYRGYRASGEHVHAYNWYDPQGEERVPSDSNGHGSHTMGTIAGAGNGTADRPSIGVAPGVNWISAEGCENLFCNDADLIASAEWMLAPTLLDGSQPRPDLRPMIINNSWSGTGGDPWYAPYTTAWRAAGIFPVFAAGNADALVPQRCGSIGSPADYSDVMAVGATSISGTIAGFSLFGPSKAGRLKPDVVAPGAAIYSATAQAKGVYATLSGTSMAAPHVAGAVALLWSANPGLIGNYDATYALLRDTAVARSDTRCGGQPGEPNNVYGYGMIDTYAATAQARVDVPWLVVPPSGQALAASGSASLNITLDSSRVPGPGVYQARLLVYTGGLNQAPSALTITMRVADVAEQVLVVGKVRNAETGAPVQATVTPVRDGRRGVPVQTDADGNIRLTLLDKTSYQLSVSAPSFQTLTRTITSAPDLQLDIQLQPDLPRIVTASEPYSLTLDFNEQRELRVPIENTGTRTLYYQVDIPSDPFGVARSDQPNGPAYSWVELPSDAKTLPVNRSYLAEVPMGIKFPFFGFAITQTVVTADGMIGFDPPMGYDGPTSLCLPDDEFDFYMIAPLRLDIDLSRGGRVRYGTINNRTTFVVSYEDVVLADGPSDATYSFQALLWNDGRIVFQYRSISPLPPKASVGIQRSPLDVLQIGCGVTTPIHDSLAVELRPQIESDQWLISGATSGMLAPGERVEIPLTLRWVRPVTPESVFMGRLRIASNDITNRHVTVPVHLRTRPALFEQFLLMASTRR